jgi:acetylornithine/N-succinyldiaminopimelate aminotransferase
MNDPYTLSRLLGPKGASITAAMEDGLRFLEALRPAQLLENVGMQVQPFSLQPISKSALQDSYGGAQAGPSDDFLVGTGLFYIGEQGRLFLDCTSGHYQMVWGYNHPVLCRVLQEGMRAGIVWDNHSNIPQSPLKQLAHRLVEVANAPGQPDPLDTVLLGVCTGSVACAAAVKIQLKVYERTRSAAGIPVMLTLEGNYHGTDMVPQFMRGMWPNLAHPFQIVTLPPNCPEALDEAFQKYGPRVMGFWAEPVMMNREAIAVEGEYLRLARRWCDEVGALLCIDEIQTGFWQPEIFAYRAMGVRPDLVIAGKGMTAGFHPLSAVIYKQRYDVLAQYDAISTNGSAAMPALIALASMALIEQHCATIRANAARIEAGFRELVAEFPDRLLSAQGRGHLSGIKFREVGDALDFHGRLLTAGLWTRVHAYHEGHSTLLTKLGLLADRMIADFLLDKVRSLLRQ